MAKKTAKTADTATASPRPSPRRRLDTLPRIRREMILLYFEAREGQIDPGDATRLGWLLERAGKMIADAELEARIARLEALAEGSER